MIIKIPYRSPDIVRCIQSTFERINLQGLGIENAAYLNTKVFSEEEKKNRKLDFLGGFEIMDSDFRMFVIEGLGGKGKGMEQFYKANEREKENDGKFTMLYNPEVRFKHRLYMNFNCVIKKIRLRNTLTQTIGEPAIYSRKKVAEDMYDTLQKFAFIRRCDRMSQVHGFNLFPATDVLEIMERKYGDSLNYEDLHGVKQRRKKKRHALGTDSIGEVSCGRTDGRTDNASITQGGFSEAQTSMAGRATPLIIANMDDDDSDEEIVSVLRKRNPDTDHRNVTF